MLKRAVAVLLLALLAAYADLFTTLKVLLIPPSLPLHYAALPHSTKPLQSFTLHSSTSSPSRLELCEDATEWGERRVLLSCDPFRKDWNTVMGPLKNATVGRGGLWVIEPSDDAPEPKEVELQGFPESSEFHPLGIEVVASPGEEGDRLFVINHQALASTIEIFLLTPSPPTARYLTTLRHPSFTAPNSLAILSPTSFYLTHDHHYTRRAQSFPGPLLNLIETLGRRALSRVDLVEFALEGEKPSIEVETVASGIAFANGAALSHDKKTLAVASTSARSLLLFSRDPSTNGLTRKEEIPLPFFVDNLSLAPRGFLSPSRDTKADAESKDSDDIFIAAGHPAYLPLLLTSRNVHLSPTSAHPSSWVLAISPRSSSSISPSAENDPAYEHVAPHPRFALTTLFQSSGGSEYDQQAFGMSTTGVVGREEGGRWWIAVVGLYERGVRVLREE
ncbi:hypothetical protein BCR35DRAFT_288971 [Leucosporidium creatinivorum]|uniref:Uncharacterized protein n=1 Tax=Leucosporidium creatinivorum TaxID=106004 RepID=A0A1Y2FYK5_9BASI|nr:hypothetical protein BCR35DRAFT_288971 [Leucosporidium creatinivorum]